MPERLWRLLPRGAGEVAPPQAPTEGDMPVTAPIAPRYRAGHFPRKRGKKVLSFVRRS